MDLRLMPRRQLKLLKVVSRHPGTEHMPDTFDVMRLPNQMFSEATQTQEDQGLVAFRREVLAFEYRPIVGLLRREMGEVAHRYRQDGEAAGLIYV